MIGADDACRHDRRQAHGPGAEDGDVGSGRDCKRVHHGAGPGLQAAAQGRQMLQRQVPGNHNDVAFGRQAVGGKRRLPEEVSADAAAPKRIAAVEALEAEVRLIKALAIRGASVPAWRASATGLKGHHYVIALRDPFYASSDLLHDARALVAQDDRFLGAVPVVDDTDIRVADARGNEPHEEFICTRTLQFEGLDLQTAAPLAQNGRPNLVH